MGRLLLAVIVTTIVLYVWNMLAWMVLGIHQDSFRSLPNDTAVMASLTEHVSEQGVYYFPAWEVDDSLDDEQQKAAQQAWIDAHTAGPLGMIVYNPQGVPPMAPRVLATGFGLNLLTALIAAGLLAAAGLRSFVGRVVFVVAIGALVCIVSDLAYWNWVYFPTDYTRDMIIDHMIGWALAGIVLAAIIRPRPAADAAG